MSEPPIEDPGTILGWADAPVSGDRVNVFDAPIVAGDPDGARIEIRSTGFHAFNGSGTETAHIDGAEGVFVGGEFRTSDALPGQVRIADDGYQTHLDGGGTWPGLGITPIDTSEMVTPAGIGPSELGTTIYSGLNTSGESSVAQLNHNGAFLRAYSPGGAQGSIFTSPAYSLLRTYRDNGATGGEVQTALEYSRARTYREDGSIGGSVETSQGEARMQAFGDNNEYGWVRAQPGQAEVAYIASDNTYFSRLRATDTEAHMFTRAGGHARYLSIDATGVWVKEDGWDDIDLTAAYRSPWTNLDYRSELVWPHGAPLGYSKIGNRVFLRGRIAKADGSDFPAGGFQEIYNFHTSMSPKYTTGVLTPAQGTASARVEISSADGSLTVTPNAATSWVCLDGLFYDVA